MQHYFGRLLLSTAQVLGVISGLSVFFILRNRYQHPNKSFLTAAINVLASPFRYLGVGVYRGRDVSVEAAMDHVKKAFKLDDFGDLEFIDRYKAIEEIMNKDGACYNNLGYIIASVELQFVFARRLLLVDYLKRNPVVAKVPLVRPIFVFGLGRSGTTFLHRLLALDPSLRAPLAWELGAPVPDSKTCTAGADPAVFLADRQARRAFLVKCTESYHSLGDDGLEKFHERGCDLPEECLY
eukprot:gene31996-38688_t